MNHCKTTLIFLIFCCLASFSKAQNDCHPGKNTSVEDFYLNNYYYATCTDYASSANGSKLFAPDPNYVDFNKDSRITFDHIYVSKTGYYTVKFEYAVGYMDDTPMEVYCQVNGEDLGIIYLPRGAGSAPYAHEFDVLLKQGIANTIVFQQKKDWTCSYRLSLAGNFDEEEEIDPGMLPEAALSLTSGETVLRVMKNADNSYHIEFLHGKRLIPTLDPDQPVHLEVGGTKLAGRYTSCELKNEGMTCQATLTSTAGSRFSITDKYIPKNEGRFELQRILTVDVAKAGDSYFNSLFGFRTNESSHRLNQDEFFIPGVWYASNFKQNGNIPSGIPRINDTYFYYREDRLPLPIVMTRRPNNGLTIAITHKDAKPLTVMADNSNTHVHAEYQYGSLGVKRQDNVCYTTFLFPGTEEETRGRRGKRAHPVRTGISHRYDLELSFSTTDDYPSAVKTTWERAFDLYNPRIYTVDMPVVYNGLINTMLTYYVPSVRLGGVHDAGGWPFSVDLGTFQARGIDYQMGFVGMQVASGYYFFREGIEKNKKDMREKGEDVLNFWATKSQTTLGLPRGWYQPETNGKTGWFRNAVHATETNMRVWTGGMEALTSAWCFAKKNGIDRPDWINACIRFGDWLVTNQNSDGSYYFCYNADLIENGKHPVVDYNKFLTIYAVRYLVELHIATGKDKYKEAALKAGAFCYENSHNEYIYAAGVVDNPRTIDSESGLMTTNGFLALYDLTKDKKWLEAAEQAATFTETWVYSFEIPVESDRTGATKFPRDKSIVGQHLIAIGHSASDLGFSWAAFVYYRLYLETGHEHYLKIARMSAHNTKQSMNWDGKLYPGWSAGLQLEAFQVTIPRRSEGVMESLNWNYAAHLDPMFRFKDAFGTPDIEAVEKLSNEEKQRLNAIYRELQSSNYGQKVDVSIDTPVQQTFAIYPNPSKASAGSFFLELPESVQGDLSIAIHKLSGEKVFGLQTAYESPLCINASTLSSGFYLVSISGEKINQTRPLIIR